MFISRQFEPFKKKLKIQKRGESKALRVVGRIRIKSSDRWISLKPEGGTPCPLRLEGRLTWP